MSERFYTNCPLAPGPVELDGPEAHHLAAVCRLRPGDAVCLFNGDGADYLATVVDVAKKRVSLDVTERRLVDRELAFRLEVAASLPKGDRTPFLVEKLTELGVTAFTPLICARSAIHPKESALEKLRRYAIEASKQCGRNVLMRIEPAAPWREYASPRAAEVRLFAHPGGVAGISPSPPGTPGGEGWGGLMKTIGDRQLQRGSLHWDFVARTMKNEEPRTENGERNPNTTILGSPFSVLHSSFDSPNKASQKADETDIAFSSAQDSAPSPPTPLPRSTGGEGRLIPAASLSATDARRTSGSAYRCAVGPEGGFTADEVESARVHGWHGVDLGPRILRVETAALALALKAIDGVA